MFEETLNAGLEEVQSFLEGGGEETGLATDLAYETLAAGLAAAPTAVRPGVKRLRDYEESNRVEAEVEQLENDLGVEAEVDNYYVADLNSWRPVDLLKEESPRRMGQYEWHTSIFGGSDAITVDRTVEPGTAEFTEVVLHEYLETLVYGKEEPAGDLLAEQGNVQMPKTLQEQLNNPYSSKAWKEGLIQYITDALMERNGTGRQQEKNYVAAELEVDPRQVYIERT